MAVADLPPQGASTFHDVCPYYELEGDSGRELIDRFGMAIQQWRNRPSVLVNSIEDTESTSHLPFAKAGTMKVRFKFAGPMTLRVIDMEDVIEE